MSARRFTQLINARGTFTPVGVSRSSPSVAESASKALSQYYVMDELYDAVDTELARFSGAQAGTMVNCTAASITVAVAAVLAGSDMERIAALPQLLPGMRSRVVIPAAHVVNYGHSILQAIRIAGAKPLVVDTKEELALARGLAHPDVACLLLVASRLTDLTSPVSLPEAVCAAHAAGVPAIIDAAAQDLRAGQICRDTYADLVLFSGQKYLASPTAGLIVGSRHYIDSVKSQAKGIGRGMKASKEAIVGVLAALQERFELDLPRWKAKQEDKVNLFAAKLANVPGIQVRLDPDPTQLPFSRPILVVESPGVSAHRLSHALKHGDPPIWFFDDRLAKGEMSFELVQLDHDEVDMIINRIRKAVLDMRC